MVQMDLQPTQGHEQQGTRPCVVVSDEAVNSNQRFPLIAVVPVVIASFFIQKRLVQGISGGAVKY